MCLSLLHPASCTSCTLLLRSSLPAVCGWYFMLIVQNHRAFSIFQHTFSAASDFQLGSALSLYTCSSSLLFHLSLGIQYKSRKLLIIFVSMKSSPVYIWICHLPIPLQTTYFFNSTPPFHPSVDGIKAVPSCMVFAAWARSSSREVFPLRGMRNSLVVF